MYRTDFAPFARAQCQSLCEATKQDERAKHDEHCNAYAFKRAAPFSFTDQTGWCYLLQVGLRAQDPISPPSCSCNRPITMPSLHAECRWVQAGRLFRRAAHEVTIFI